MARITAQRDRRLYARIWFGTEVEQARDVLGAERVAGVRQAAVPLQWRSNAVRREIAHGDGDTPFQCSKCGTLCGINSGARAVEAAVTMQLQRERSVNRGRSPLRASAVHAVPQNICSVAMQCATCNRPRRRLVRHPRGYLSNSRQRLRISFLHFSTTYHKCTRGECASVLQLPCSRFGSVSPKLHT